jgi:hypothetical protein
MDTNQIFQALGGRAEVMRITGLSKGRLSQMATENSIPRSWMLLFHQLCPREIPHPDAETPSSSKEDAHA